MKTPYPSMSRKPLSILECDATKVFQNANNLNFVEKFHSMEDNKTFDSCGFFLRLNHSMTSEARKNECSKTFINFLKQEYLNGYNAVLLYIP